jgi:hypothetical protein
MPHKFKIADRVFRNGDTSFWTIEQIGTDGLQYMIMQQFGSMKNATWADERELKPAYSPYNPVVN